jgi:hypothetical protein
MMDETQEAKAVFEEAYRKDRDFGKAASEVVERTGYNVRGDDGYISDLLFCWAADIEQWRVAGATSNHILSICPGCGEMYSVNEIFIHKQRCRKYPR